MNKCETTEEIMTRMNVRLGLFVRQQENAMMHRRIFFSRSITSDESANMHNAVVAAIGKTSRGLAVKAELFALLYLCQPEALFRKKRLLPSVSAYAGRHLGLCTATISAQKQNLAFLFFNDKKFRAVASRAVEAAQLTAQKNQQRND